MRPSVNDANKFLRQTVKSVEAGGVATLARAMEHPGILQEIHVTTLDASDAEIPAAAGFSAVVKLPTRIESKNLVIVGKFPVATQAEYNALSDAMKDQSVVVTVDEAPIGSELKAYATDALGNVVGCTKWIMDSAGWIGAGGITPTPSGAFSLAGPLLAPNVAPRRSMATWTPFPVGNVSASTNTGSVGQLVIRAPCEFSRVRIWAGNNSGAPVTAITKILAAVSANLTTWSPSVGGALTEDQTTGWITADADGITVPAAAASIGGQEVPAYASSAIFSIKSIPADDGGRPWLFFRHPWAATNIGYRWIESSNHAFNPNDDAGAWMRYRRVANADYSYCGASAEAGGTALTASTDLGLCPIFRVDFWADDAGWTSVDMIGGSTMAISANDSETYALSWLRLANKTLLDHRINLATYGVPGANTAHYYEMALISIANSPSKHIFFAVYSGNDGSWTQAAVDAMLRRFFTIKAIAADAGKVVIPVIMLHDSVGTSSTNRDIRIAANAKLRASGDVLDFGEVVGDPLNRDKFADGMSSDGVHFTDAGRLAVAAWAPAKIAEIVRKNPAWAA